MPAVINAIIVVIIAMIAMYFKFVIRKILLVFGFPKLETIHPELGEYNVGALKIRLSKDLTPCQLFYPVEKDAKRANKKFVGYYRPQAVKGLIKFMETGESADGVLQFLQDAKHPNLKYYGAEPMSATTTTTTSKKNGSKFPLVVFSHGLSGTIEGYTQLCSQLASLGCVVVAPEHADSSASYSSKVLEDGSIQEIWYQAPTPDSVEPYSREKMVRYRGPHAEIRVDELTALYAFLNSGQKVSYKEKEDHHHHDHHDHDVRIANAVLDSFDPLNLHLVGHSFGSSTQLLAAQRWATQQQQQQQQHAAPKIVPLTITVCDTWNFALSDEIISKGIPKTTTTTNVSPPILSVISNEWVSNPEVEPLKEFLRQSQPHCGVTSYYAKNSMHQSFSDTEAWLPTSLAVSFENRGQGEERHVTIRAVVSAFSKHTGIGSEKEGSIIEALVEYPIDK